MSCGVEGYRTGSEVEVAVAVAAEQIARDFVRRRQCIGLLLSVGLFSFQVVVAVV